MEGYSAFFYGTLMAEQVLYRVLYGSMQPHADQLAALKIQPAVLPCYVRHRVACCDYPAIIASPVKDACVRGTYVQGITAADQWRLDIFEGDQYERRMVRPVIIKADGSFGAEVAAETYVWVAPREELEDREWDFEEFRREKMSRWTGQSVEYSELDEAIMSSKISRDPTGGRFPNGQLAKKFDGHVSVSGLATDASKSAA